MVFNKRLVADEATYYTLGTLITPREANLI